MYVTEIKEKQIFQRIRWQLRIFATGFFEIFVFLLFPSHTPEVYSNHYTVCMFYCIGIYNKHCLSLQKLKNDNTQHTRPLKFSNLVIVHTLDFWYMIKNK